MVQSFNIITMPCTSFIGFPQQWGAMSVREKALVIAGIDLRIEQDKREARANQK